MKYGGWNECPAPGVHAAFYREWFKRYQAVPIAMTHDVVEMHVANPPQTPEDAWQLAQEQYAFCADIVEQGTGTIDVLARGLWQSPYWYFWWD